MSNIDSVKKTTFQQTKNVDAKDPKNSSPLQKEYSIFDKDKNSNIKQSEIIEESDIKRIFDSVSDNNSVRDNIDNSVNLKSLLLEELNKFKEISTDGTKKSADEANTYVRSFIDKTVSSVVKFQKSTNEPQTTMNESSTNEPQTTMNETPHTNEDGSDIDTTVNPHVL